MPETDNVNMVNALTVFTLLNDATISSKFMTIYTETKFTADDASDLALTIKQIKDVCEIARSKGTFSISSYSDSTNNPFFKNITFMLSKKWAEVTGQSAILYYWVKPILLSDNLKGIEFLKAILIYEGIVMATVGGFDSNLIEFRLNSLLGKTMLLENMFS